MRCGAIIRLIIYCVSFVFFLRTEAQVRFVDATMGVDDLNCGSSGMPCNTIQYTVDNIALNNDTIYLKSGNYSLSSSVSSDSAIIELPVDKSFYFYGDTVGSGAIINGRNSRRGFRYDYSGNCPLSNTGANTVSESRRFGFENLTITNCFFSAVPCPSIYYAEGGGIFIKGDPLDSLFVSIRNCNFSNNYLEDLSTNNTHGRATSGAGVFVEGRNAIYTSVVVQQSYFSQNEAEQVDNGGNGAAIALKRLNYALIEDSEFCSNVVRGINTNEGDLLEQRNSGSAIHIFDDNDLLPRHEFTINNCSFVDNVATSVFGSTFSVQSVGAVFLSNSGGVRSNNTSVLKVGNSHFYNNTNEVGISHIGNNAGTLDTTSIGGNTFAPKVDSLLGEDVIACPGIPYTLGENLPQGRYLWSTGSTNKTIQVSPMVKDTFWVEVGIAGCFYRDTIVVTLDTTTISLGPDLTLCPPFSFELSPGQGYHSYLWQDGSTSSSFRATQAGVYSVTIGSGGSCLYSDTMIVTNAIEVDLGVDTALCPPFNYTLNLGSGYDNYLWQNGSVDSSFTIVDTGTYAVTVTNNDGCSATDSIKITNDLEVDLGNDTSFCSAFSYTLSPGLGYTSYLWQDGSTNTNYTATTTGGYSVVVSNGNGCSVSDSVIISNDADVLDLGDDLFFCSEFDYIINPGAGFASYRWQDGSTAPTLYVNTPGTYSVSIVTSNGCTAQDSLQLVIDTFSIDLGKDRLFCTNFNYQLNPGINVSNYLWNDGSTESTLTVDTTGEYSVLVTNNSGCTASDTVQIVSGVFSIDLGNDSSFCSRSVYKIGPGLGYTSYLWQDGSTNDQYTVTTSGTYSVEVTNDLGCSVKDTIVLDAKIFPFSLGSDTAICADTFLELSVTVDNASYTWQDGTTDTLFTVEKTGTYSVNVEVDACILSDTIAVFILDLGESLIQYDTLCAGDLLELDATTANSNYEWEDGSRSSDYTVSSGGIFKAQVSNVCGIFEKTFVVRYDDCACVVYIPNAFTPNADGNNDVFRPVSECIFSEYKFLVFNRWGEQLFETEDPFIGWNGLQNGEKASLGKYYYKLFYRGERETFRKQKEGKITLIR